MGNYFKIVENSTTNGPGIRTSIFLSGCNLHCKGCFNKEVWDFNSGKKIGKQFFNLLEKSLIPEYISGITILGGEPLDKKNLISTNAIVDFVKNKFSNKTIWIYTGYIYEDLIIDSNYKKLFNKIDVLVDGPWIESLFNPTLPFRGSSNQRIIDTKNSKILYT